MLVIGNGFDVAHGINSRYSDFKDWLIVNDYDLLERMSEYFPIANEKGIDWWGDFENNLDSIDAHDKISQIVADNYPDLSRNEFRDRDYLKAEQAMDIEMKTLYNNITDAFVLWVKSLECGKLSVIFDLHEFDMFQKPTSEIIDKYRLFFDQCIRLDEISFYGFSFAPVDMPYVKALADFNQRVLTSKSFPLLISCHHQKFQVCINATGTSQSHPRYIISFCPSVKTIESFCVLRVPSANPK